MNNGRQKVKKGESNMKRTYFTITGMNYYYGTDVVKRGMTVKLVKEPDNKYDKEAILVKKESAWLRNVTGSVEFLKISAI